MSAAQEIGTLQTVTRTLRVELSKARSHTADELFGRLRLIRSVAHRLYTASALAAIRVDRAELHGKPERYKGKDLHPQTAAYHAVEEELSEIRAWAKKKKLDGLALLELPGGMKSSIAGLAYTGFRKWRADKGRARVPTWKHGAPIPCRAAEARVYADASGTIVVSVQLDTRGRYEFSVTAGRGSHWDKLRTIATGGVKLGDIKLVYGVRDAKWYALIAYTETAPTPPDHLDPEHVMVIHRGQRNLLVCATNQGRYSVLATGAKLRAFKRQIAGRRKEMQTVTRAERGNGAHGHGRARRYDLNERLSEREAAFLHTLCQQMGARVAQLVEAWGCGRVLIEGYGGIEPGDDRGKRMYLERFPNHELKTCIEWALKKIGVELGEYEHAFMSQACPACGNVDEAQHNRRTGVFHCRACSFDRPVDVTGVIFALRKACDGYAGTWEERLARERRIAGALKLP